MVFTAGQIGLQPATMTLAPPTDQPALSLTHVTSVLEANHAHLSSALCGLCYYTSEEAGWAARATWREVPATCSEDCRDREYHYMLACVCVCVCAVLPSGRGAWPSHSVCASAGSASRGVCGVDLH